MSEQDRIKANKAKIKELQDKLSSMDYIVVQRKREEDLGLDKSKSDDEYKAILNEMQLIVEEIRNLENGIL